MSRSYYLYRHIRLDKNEVFYVGIGTKENKKFRKFESEYTRAFSKHNRNKHWHSIVSINPNFKVEILYEHTNLKFIEEKEREFVKLYGRRDLGLGTLCNFTDGGDGVRNFIPSDKHKISSSERMKKFNSIKWSKDNSKFLSKQAILVLDTRDGKVYRSIREASRETGFINNNSLSRMLRGLDKNTTPFILHKE